uniref:PB1 domain-containing protein n=2 Tax=Leersia perrieri TaxID=77586 RepID=A0A0D9W6P2_9ORYZ
MDMPTPSNRAGCNGNISSCEEHSDDPYGTAAMNFDSYPEICSPSVADQLFSLLNDPAAHRMFAMWSSSMGSSPRAAGMSEDIQLETYSGLGEAVEEPSQIMSVNPTEAERTSKSSSELGSDNGAHQGSSIVPRSLVSNSLADRMLMALSLFRESLGNDALAQVWMPIEQEGHVLLSTCEQPFLLDQVLAGYREASRHFVFSAKEEPGLHPGLPGRVFISGVPEWTSSVRYYNRPEYLRMEHALHHDIRGSLAMPIYDPSKDSCCAVLELVTKKEKPDFSAEMDSVCNALQASTNLLLLYHEAVNLKAKKDSSNQKFYTDNQKLAFTEILDVLRAICHAHMLPLALTWVPTSNGSDGGYIVGKDSAKNSQSGKAILQIHESACYVNDTNMQCFFQACAKRHLEKGQGIAGRALKSNLPFFSPNVKEYSIEDYPLAHHARKFGLHAAVAIRLRSTYTGNDDYILEFFLPVNCRGSGEQQMLLNKLSSTMQRICKSLRTVYEGEVDKVSACTAAMFSKTNESCLPTGRTESSSHDDQPITEASLVNEPEVMEPELAEQVQSSSTRHADKKRSTAEKNISLDVLRKYFSGSLKDAAKSLGVNRSLKKIQTVINSVHGVDRSLQYDPATGSLVPVVSLPEKLTFPCDALPTPSVEKAMEEKSGPKSEQGYSSADGSLKQSCQLHISDVKKSKGDEFHVQTSNYIGSGDSASYGANVMTKSNSEGAQGPLCPAGAFSALHIKGTDCTNLSASLRPSSDTTRYQIVGRNSPSTQQADIDMLGGHEKGDHIYPSTSGMTDSSSGSASSQPTFKQNIRRDLKDKTSPALTVKATYNGDTVRFKFLPSMGWYHLLEEIAKRFKLSTGAFQIKYKDDEDEWVILANDSDLQECVDVLDSIGSHNVKLQEAALVCSWKRIARDRGKRFWALVT